MLNPVLDQERMQYLQTRQDSVNRKMLLPAWPRREKELPCVDLEVKWVRFSTLNHRTRSEQMRITKQQGRPDLFTADPMGPEAQEEQYAILAEQEEFHDLKSDLKNRGQQQPAIVTAEGVLINGNRRVAALRSLFLEDDHKPSRYVSCLILPADATVEELVDLETELQVAREFKEDYTWVNEALLIEEIFDREGKSWKKVASRMRMDVSAVRAQHEKLQLLHQLVALSKGTRHHADFVPNESAFTELAKHVKGKPVDEAASVRATYFLGILTGVNYRTLRHLRRPDASILVCRELENDTVMAPMLKSSMESKKKEPDILDDVLGDKTDQEGGNLTSALSYLARLGQSQEVDLDGTTVPTVDLKESVKNAVDMAAEEAHDQSKDKDTVTAPVKYLETAIKKVKRASQILPKARVLEQWEEDEFGKRVSQLRELVDSIGAEN